MYAAVKLPIKCWAEDDRPREKLITKGKHLLSNAELLAIVISSGNRHESAVELCKRMLADSENNLEKLSRFTLAELMRYSGMGEAKSLAVMAALELGRRRATTSMDDVSYTIQSSADSWRLVRPDLEELDHEQFWMLLLNRANKLIRKEQVSRGGTNSTVVDPKIIFKSALSYGASSIVLAHNHPSGTLLPSESDLRLTRRLRDAASLLEIAILDHLIVGANSYFSFADEGVL